MPKKDFKNNPALAFIGTQKTQGTDEPQEPQGTQATLPAPADHEPAAPAPARYYRLNLKLKAEYKDYLERVSWENHQSITQYLNDLIERDKATNDTQDT